LYTFLIQALGKPANDDASQIDRLLNLSKERAKTLSELKESVAYFFGDELAFNETDVREFLTKAQLGPLKELQNKLSSLESFDEKNLGEAFQEVLKACNLKMVQLAQPVRVALTGRKTSPGIYEVMLILGRKRVEDRLARAIRIIGE
jgi:glutamyl-tRNA synthetase